ncbi:Rdx family-domain-containing protein [Fusarium oxysporum]|nr:Rdx family-domain-containing protein [Fusarium oxysporum]
MTSQASTQTPLPRVSIQFCTQCKWMLRAAYYAQELLSTFSTGLGEVALQPSTGGTFIVTITHQAPVQALLLQRPSGIDGKMGAFLRRRSSEEGERCHEPGRDLGHVDRDHGKKEETAKDKPVETENVRIVSSISQASVVMTWLAYDRCNECLHVRHSY